MRGVAESVAIYIPRRSIREGAEYADEAQEGPQVEGLKDAYLGADRAA